MTISFTRYGSVDLPEYNPVTQAGTLPAVSGLVRTTDGSYFDRHGDKQAYQDGGTLSMTATYHSDQADISERKYNELLSMNGKADWLYRRQWGTYYDTRRWARLEYVDYRPRFFNLTTYFDIRMFFVVTGYCWNGQRYGDWEIAGRSMKAVQTSFIPGVPALGAVTWTASGGESSATITAFNQGNVDARGVLIQVAGGSSSLSGFRIHDGLNYDLVYTGTISSGAANKIRIDTFAKSIKDQDGTGLYGAFDYGGNGNRSDYLVIPPGATDFTITPNSSTFPANTEVTLHYADAWQ